MPCESASDSERLSTDVTEIRSRARVGQLVSLHVGCITKPLTTESTRIGLLACMLLHMPTKTSGRCVRLTARRAHKRLLPRMCTDMTYEVRILGEAAVAVSAHIGPVVRVKTSVSLEYIQVRKSIAAHLAYKGPLPRMHTHVSVEVTLRPRSLTADLAFERPLAGMGAHVHAKRASIRTLLSTLATLVRILLWNWSEGDHLQRCKATGRFGCRLNRMSRLLDGIALGGVPRRLRHSSLSSQGVQRR